MLKEHEKLFKKFVAYLESRYKAGELARSTFDTWKSIVKKWLNLLEQEHITDLKEGYEKVKLPYHMNKVRAFIDFLGTAPIIPESAIHKLEEIGEMAETGEETGLSEKPEKIKIPYEAYIGKPVVIRLVDGQDLRAEVKAIDVEARVVEVLLISKKVDKHDFRKGRNEKNKGTAAGNRRKLIPFDSILHLSSDERLFR